MEISLISPRLVIQKEDFLGSGVPYWPIELATFAAFLRERKYDVRMFDLFGNNPKKLSDKGTHYLQGENITKYIPELKSNDAIIIFAISYMSHNEITEIIKSIRRSIKDIPIFILENSQAVTAYSVQRVSESLLNAGANYIICGEPYYNWDEIKNLINKVSISNVKNIISSKSNNDIERLIKKFPKYPIPAWDLINLKNYWNLPYSHGPKTRKYLPMLSSRGCPYPCDFCVVPETNNRRWRANAPEDVVNEILELKKLYGVLDFQIEDLNPTIDHKRWEKICKLLIEAKAGIRFYFVSGTKAETIHINSIKLFADAGCRYISISPESGSPELMRKVGKKFNYEHGLDLVRKCKKYGIATQTCFIVGHPNETQKDINLSKIYIKNLVKSGLDEVAVFIVSPFAGSEIFSSQSIKIENNKEVISFSPKGRKEYKYLTKQRSMLISTFFIQKIKNHFFSVISQVLRSLFGVPRTKMENLPRRIIYINFLTLVNRFSLNSD